MTKKEIELIEKIARVNSLRVVQRLHEKTVYVRRLVEEDISKLSKEIAGLVEKIIAEDKKWWQFRD